MTAKACGRMFQNSPRWLWKEPVSAAHNRGNNTPVGCGWKVDISPQHPWPKTKETGRLARPVPNGPRNGRYFSELLMVSKFVLSLLPRPFTAVMIAIAIPAAIQPYSMAVAPDSSLKNDLMTDFIAGSDLGFMFLEPRVLPQFLSRNLRE